MKPTKRPSRELEAIKKSLESYATAYRKQAKHNQAAYNAMMTACEHLTRAIWQMNGETTI